ncbi:hypothetical protein [Streptomyces sp. NPDC000994]
MSAAPRPSSLGGIGLGAAEERLYQRLVEDGPLVPAVRGRAAARLVALGLAAGRRTVQRRVRRLMDLTGTETRLQLGWCTRYRGWL